MRINELDTEKAQIELSYFSVATDDFRTLTAELDSELREKNGELQSTYTQFNQLDDIKDFVIAFKNGQPIGCSSMKYYAEGVFEIKRVFVLLKCRGSGVASRMMRKLEVVALSRGANQLILETGDVLDSAIKMYTRLGFQVIPNYGQYENMKASVCMSKKI